ncbi:MAG: chemotaxis protein CheW [Thermincolia bacterium]
MGEAKGISEEGQMVIFRLGREKFGVPIGKVREIITMQNITQVPRTHHCIEGIINLRGKVIPIFNIIKKLNLPQSNADKSARIIVVQVDGHTIGMIVDEVSEVLTIQSSITEKPSDLLVSGLDERYMDKIAKIDSQLIIVLNLENLMSINGQLKNII